MKKLYAIIAAAAIAMPLIAGCAAFAADPPEARCIYCGSTSYGHCGSSPESNKKHKHGSNSQRNKCVWCGLGKTQADAYACQHGPNGKHEF